MCRSKLYRNLKPGDRFMVSDDTSRNVTVTVRSVQECRPGFMTGRRRWEIHADYPWWFMGPVVAYAADRVGLV